MTAPIPSPSADAVRAQLDRLLTSAAFVNAGRLSRLLRFLVERTLAGEGDSLKEYVLGVEVFDRSADYDPRLDSIVRVEARRLRARLAEHYAGPGAQDPVIVTVEKGSYVPTFTARESVDAAAAAAEAAVGGTCTPAERRDAATPGARPPVAAREPIRQPWPAEARWSSGGTRPVWFLALMLVTSVVTLTLVFWQAAGREPAAASTRVPIAVLPLERYDEDATRDGRDVLAQAVTDGLIAELARQPALEVASRASVLAYRERRLPVREIAAALAVRAVVEGTVRVSGSQIALELRIVDAERDRKVWVDEFTGELSDRRGLERRTAAAIAAVVQEALAERR
jgi:TolB-like protein